MKRRLAVLGAIVLYVVGFMCATALPVWAVQIDFGLSASYTKVGDMGTKGDTYSPGHHSMVVHGDDIFTTWVRGDSSSKDIVATLKWENGDDVFYGTETVMKDEYYPNGPSIAVADSLANPARRIVHIAWTTGNKEVKYSRSKGWNSYSAPVLLNAPTMGSNWGVSIAADNSGSGNVYAVWSASADENVYVARSLDEGLNWEAPVMVYSSPNRDLLPSVAVDEGGNVHLSWETKPGIGYSRSNDGGKTWNTVVGASGPTGPTITGSGNWPSVASRNGTDIYISWYVVGSGIYCSYSHDGGTSWGEPEPSLVSTVTGMTSLAVSPDGDVSIVHGSGGIVTLLRSKDGGESWGKPYIAGSNGDDPHVAIGQNNKAVIMWGDDYGYIVAFTREQ